MPYTSDDLDDLPIHVDRDPDRERAAIARRLQAASGRHYEAWSFWLRLAHEVRAILAEREAIAPVEIEIEGVPA